MPRPSANGNILNFYFKRLVHYSVDQKKIEKMGPIDFHMIWSQDSKTGFIFGLKGFVSFRRVTIQFLLKLIYFYNNSSMTNLTHIPDILLVPMKG